MGQQKQAVIITHQNVDADAVASVWAVARFNSAFANAKEMFVPADWDGEIPDSANVLLLDIHAGGRGLKGKRHDDGTVGSCFRLVLDMFAPEDARQALEGLMRFIEMDERRGSVFPQLFQELEESPDTLDMLENTSLYGLLRALKSSVGRGEGGDTRVVEGLKFFFDWFLENGMKRIEAEEIIQEGRLVSISKQGVALVKNVRNHRVTDVLFKWHGVRAVVYVKGRTLGVLRENSETFRTDHPLIRQVVENAGEADEWFAHSSGFLFCRGSRKTGDLKNYSKVKPRRLFRAVNDMFAEHLSE